MRLLISAWQRFGLWRCSRGHHAPLQWVGNKRRPRRVRGQAQEMFEASGLGDLAKWNGWCPRCEQAVEWADHDPRQRRAS